MSDLMTPEDVKDVTGYAQAAQQCQALRDSGVRYVRRQDGRPSLTWTVFNNSLSPQAGKQEAGGDGFNLGALTD